MKNLKKIGMVAIVVIVVLAFAGCRWLLGYYE